VVGLLLLEGYRPSVIKKVAAAPIPPYYIIVIFFVEFLWNGLRVTTCLTGRTCGHEMQLLIKFYRNEKGNGDKPSF
jgi:hypothetical protein